MRALLSTAALCSALLTACSTLQPTQEKATADLSRSTLAEAADLMKRADRIRLDDQAANVYRLRAAEIAWSHLDTDGGTIKNLAALSPDQRQALALITTATEKVAADFIGPKYQPEKNFSYGGHRYKVSAGLAAGPGIYPLAGLESAVPAREIRHTLCKNWHTEDGVGAPSAPKWKFPTDPRLRRFVSSRTYLEPITAVLSFDPVSTPGSPRRVSITGYDPTYLSQVDLGKTRYPLAADFTAPIVAQTVDIRQFSVALTGLIHPGVLDCKLILTQPYDPQRIPVILVHGINSHPRIWKNVINDLRADPQLRNRYQFILFYYPTGWPITYSSMRFREELAAFQTLTGSQGKKMIVIGHSMGGLLSRLQVIDPQRKIWDATLGNDAEKLYQRLPSNHLAKRTLLFSPNPNIAREIYICTPQRGSSLADLSITGLFIRVLSLPTAVTTALIDLPSNIIQQGKLTSVAGLSPLNPLYPALDQIPIAVPHHSIIGDRGKGDTPHSSDGVVPYSSSHLRSTSSELIVPDNHSAYDNPQAIAELRRILLLHAGLKN